MSHAHCGCGDLCAPGSSLEIASKQLSHVVNARITEGVAKALVKYCATNSCSQSTAIRYALTKLAQESGDADAQLAAVASALGLRASATPDQVKAALQKLIGAIRSPGVRGPAKAKNTPKGMTQAMRKLSAQFQLAPDALESLLKVLNLAPTSTSDEIWNKAMSHDPMTNVVKALGLTGAPSPEDVAGAVKQLLATRDTQKALRAELDARGMIIRRGRVVVLSKDTIDKIKAKGMTLEEFETATRRA